VAVKKYCCGLVILALIFALWGCTGELEPITPETAPSIVIAPEPVPIETTLPEPSVPETTRPEPSVPETTRPEHSALYIPGVDVEDVLLWFNEVALDSEFSYEGNPNLIQKWASPIIYCLEGNATEEDLQVLESFSAWLNTLEGFPGIRQAQPEEVPNLLIRFGDGDMITDFLGAEYVNVDGGVRYWYDNNVIYDAKIAYREDIPQYTRNSVILEEIYNGLGLVQDTALREDSLIWQGFSEPQNLTEVDELLLKLLYHPEMLCGMNAEECEAVIRSLYY
jgi:hypothetical protein